MRRLFELQNHKHDDIFITFYQPPKEFYVSKNTVAEVEEPFQLEQQLMGQGGFSSAIPSLASDEKKKVILFMNQEDAYWECNSSILNFLYSCFDFTIYMVDEQNPSGLFTLLDISFATEQASSCVTKRTVEEVLELFLDSHCELCADDVLVLSGQNIALIPELLTESANDSLALSSPLSWQEEHMIPSLTKPGVWVSLPRLYCGQLVFREFEDAFDFKARRLQSAGSHLQNPIFSVALEREIVITNVLTYGELKTLLDSEFEAVCFVFEISTQDDLPAFINLVRNHPRTSNYSIQLELEFKWIEAAREEDAAHLLRELCQVLRNFKQIELSILAIIPLQLPASLFDLDNLIALDLCCDMIIFPEDVSPTNHSLKKLCINGSDFQNLFLDQLEVLQELFINSSEVLENEKGIVCLPSQLTQLEISNETGEGGDGFVLYLVRTLEPVQYSLRSLTLSLHKKYVISDSALASLASLNLASLQELTIHVEEAIEYADVERLIATLITLASGLCYLNVNLLALSPEESCTEKKAFLSKACFSDKLTICQVNIPSHNVEFDCQVLTPAVLSGALRMVLLQVKTVQLEVLKSVRILRLYASELMVLPDLSVFKKLKKLILSGKILPISNRLPESLEVLNYQLHQEIWPALKAKGFIRDVSASARIRALSLFGIKDHCFGEVRQEAAFGVKSGVQLVIMACSGNCYTRTQLGEEKWSSEEVVRSNHGVAMGIREPNQIYSMNARGEAPQLVDTVENANCNVPH